MIELAKAYESHIWEAFIEPIRSVLIVDDKYPTIEQVLVAQADNKQLVPQTNPKEVLNVIKNFRNRDPALIVDIHNGEGDGNDRVTLSQHLHQSDLLILDYELNDRGEKAVEIVKKVFSNKHFNLIVLHTSSQPIEPFERILMSFLSPCVSDLGKNDQITSGRDVIQDAEDVDPNVFNKVRAALNFQQYITFRREPRTALKSIREGAPPFTEFHQITRDFGWEKQTPSNVFYWALSEFERTNSTVFNTESRHDVRWSDVAQGGPHWVRTNQGFITFVQKAEDVDLINKLLKALSDWKPSPSRLLSSKLRATLEEEGVLAEDIALSSRHAQAKFYQNLISVDNEEFKHALIDAQLDRHLELLSSHIKPTVREYLTKVVGVNLNGIGIGELTKHHYNVDLSDGNENERAIREYNSYISCKPNITGWHLETGHIFELNGEKWVCLSPICDLVPNQKNIGVFQDVGTGRKPFMAVKLHCKTGPLDTKINSNNYLFIKGVNQIGEIEQYSFYDSTDNAASPHWSLFIADDSGRIQGDNTITINKLASSGQQMSLNNCQCKIVAQLRYEYALNLLQKLGSNFTRVGLDFIAH
ncbi:response regulator receiver domain [Methylophaga sp. OBS4]|uniref:response regulator receiver domain n=1 Tax=Methylophaga sp. OBS4 TaxID=2991935 RepID=UPI00225772EB|nr:response regulator receiver domain [Methylophaga sp. OBS4]MCX4187023.1 response regulator receiver domain [Methylophaga sp. OBS4]